MTLATFACETVPVATPPEPPPEPEAPVTAERPATAVEPIDTMPLRGLSAGFYNSCAALQSGQVRCWGDLSFGTGSPLEPLGDTVPLIDDALQIVIGRSRACALREGGRLWCWGKLGSYWFSRFDARPRPANVSDVRAIAAGADHHCAVTGSGRVRCFGNNASGQVASHYGQFVDDVDDAVEVVAGARHSCSRSADGSVTCWGGNGMNQMGDGSSRVRALPRPVPELTGVTALSAHFIGLMTCALRDGDVVCWGALGPGTGAAQTHKLGDGLVALPRLSEGEIKRIVVGPWEVCALTDRDQAWCWRQSLASARGEPDAPLFGEAEQLPAMGALRELSMGAIHSCAVDVDGHAFCWGLNINGQLGTGDTDEVAAPTAVRALAADAGEPS